MTRGFNPHVGPTHPLSPTDTIKEAEPLLPSVIPTNPIATPLDQPHLHQTTIKPKPSNWKEMTDNQKKKWLKRN